MSGKFASRLCALVLLAGLMAQTAGAAPEEQEADAVAAKCPRLDLRGVQLSEDVGFLYLELRAPGMDTPIVVRFPEVVSSEWGMHYVDAFPESVDPETPPAGLPAWEKNEVTGALFYHYETGEGLSWTAFATPLEDTVALELSFRNGTGKELRGLHPLVCLLLGLSEDFECRSSYERIGAWFDGEFKCLPDTHPPPKGKYADIGHSGSTFPGDAPGPIGALGWRLHQEADYPLIAAVSRDARYIVGTSWFDTCEWLTYNTRLSCMHAGPNQNVSLAPGEEYVWRGRVYLMENDPETLLQRFLADQEALRPNGETMDVEPSKKGGK